MSSASSSPFNHASTSLQNSEAAHHLGSACDGRKFPSDRRPNTRLRSCSFALEIPTFEQYVSPRGRLVSTATACIDHVPALLLPGLGSRQHMSPGSRCPMPAVLSAFRHASLARRDCSLLHSRPLLLLLASRLSRYCCQFLSWNERCRVLRTLSEEPTAAPSRGTYCHENSLPRRISGETCQSRSITRAARRRRCREVESVLLECRQWKLIALLPRCPILPLSMAWSSGQRFLDEPSTSSHQFCQSAIAVLLACPPGGATRLHLGVVRPTSWLQVSARAARLFCRRRFRKSPRGRMTL